MSDITNDFNNKLKDSAAPKSFNVVMDECVFYIESIDFYGTYAKSPNGKYVLAWCQDESPQINYILTDSKIMLCSGKLNSPCDGAVSNEGIFILSDLRHTNDLRSDFYIFDILGNVLLKRECFALHYNLSISQDGHYAVCFLCHSEHSDGNSLNLFDIKARTLLWQNHPKFWPENYIFDEANNGLYLLRNGEKHSVSFTGESDIWKSESDDEGICIDIGPGFEIFQYAKQMLIKLETDKDNVDNDYCQSILVLLEQSLEEGFSENSWGQALRAKVYRAKGEIFEFMDNLEMALNNYKKAIELDSDVGCKRRFNAVKKRLNA